MYNYKAKLIRAVDGDTVDLLVDMGFHTYQKLRFRLYGVDTPERGQEGFKEATDFVKGWFHELDNQCIVQTHKTGKYGRWLATISVPYADGRPTLNQQLINAGHAVEYMIK